MADVVSSLFLNTDLWYCHWKTPDESVYPTLWENNGVAIKPNKRKRSALFFILKLIDKICNILIV
jgi:hypothetical protein